MYEFLWPKSYVSWLPRQQNLEISTAPKLPNPGSQTTAQVSPTRSPALGLAILEHQLPKLKKWEPLQWKCRLYQRRALSNIPTFRYPPSSPFWKLHLSKPPSDTMLQADGTTNGLQAPDRHGQDCQKWSPLIGVSFDPFNLFFIYIYTYIFRMMETTTSGYNIKICHHLVRGHNKNHLQTRRSALNHQDGIGWYRLWTTRCLRRCCAKSCTLGR